MCYDMSFFSSIKKIADIIPPDEEPDFDVVPTWHQVAQSWHPFPVALRESNKIKLKLFEWGLIADYMNTPQKVTQYRSSMANARSEKIIHDPKSIWHRIRHQRCIVFTTGFFEHRNIQAKKKVPYFVKVKEQEVFCLAGLYNYSPLPDPETGEMIGTFTVVTRKANSLMRLIHNDGASAERMPLILPNHWATTWLRADLTDQELQTMLDYELPSTSLETWPVHTIRTRKTDDSSVIEANRDAGIPPLEHA